MGGGMALNQLLIQMDGVDEPQFWAQVLDQPHQQPARRAATWSRASSSGARCGCKLAQAAARADLLHRRDQRADRPRSTRRSSARAAWAATSGSARRPRTTGSDIFDLYLDKVDHDADLDTRQAPRRAGAHHQRLLPGDDRAGLLDGADLRALPPAAESGWDDIVQAMTTIESGHRAEHRLHRRGEPRGRDPRGRPRCRRARLHADVLSTRLSIRKRGGSLGHHQAIENEERFVAAGATRRSADIVWTLGAMAAEHVFYGENSTGVGGDVQSATSAPRRWSAARAWAPSRSTCRTWSSRATRSAREAEREYMAALRAHRPADHEPLARHARERRPDRRDPARPRQAPGRRRRSSARPTSPPSASSATTASRSPTSPTTLVERKELLRRRGRRAARSRRARGADHRHHRRHDLAQAVSDEHDDDTSAGDRPGEADASGDGPRQLRAASRHSARRIWPARSRVGSRRARCPTRRRARPPGACGRRPARTAARRRHRGRADRGHAAATAAGEAPAPPRRTHLLALLRALSVPVRRADRRGAAAVVLLVAVAVGARTTARPSRCAARRRVVEVAADRSGRRRGRGDRRPRRQGVPPAQRQAARDRHGGPMEFADFPATIAVQQPLAKGGGIDLFDEARRPLPTLRDRRPDLSRAMHDPGEPSTDRRCCCAARRSSWRSTRSATSACRRPSCCCRRRSSRRPR